MLHSGPRTYDFVSLGRVVYAVPEFFPAAEECPPDYVCQMGFVLPACCPAKQEADVAASFADTCADGTEATPAEEGGLVGLDCSDLDCPDGYECHRDVEKQFFARCCKVWLWFMSEFLIHKWFDQTPSTMVDPEAGAVTGGGKTPKEAGQAGGNGATYGSEGAPGKPPPAPAFKTPFLKLPRLTLVRSD